MDSESSSLYYSYHDDSTVQTPRVFDRYFHYSSSDDEDDDSRPSNSILATKRLDYMIQFLDRKLSTPSDTNQNSISALPEFVAKGGHTGIFSLPSRAAVHLQRPPSLEVRPHQLRETQVGCFLRTIVATTTQLWAGAEDGIRLWEFRDLYRGSAVDGQEEGTAPFRNSATGMDPCLCMVPDDGNRVVWTGHRNGRIKCWKMDLGSGSDMLMESFSWPAHRGPVLSIVITSYGDIWSGSECGVIKVWPWNAIEKAFIFPPQKRHMAASLLERSYILRSQVTVNGFSNSLSSDVKCMLSNNSTGKVWSTCSGTFALWDARSRELLKVFNVDGQMENGGGDAVNFSMEDDIQMKILVGPKKDRTQGSFGFFQRSRNAIMGAADAVRRVAAKGAFGDDNQKIEALVISIDGMIWTGCSSGLLVQWDGNGNRLQDFQHHYFAVQCLCTFGTRIWIGYISGTIQVLDLEGNLLGGWIAHSSPVISMVFGAGYIFSLANHGGIRGWNVTSPGHLDRILRSELAGKEFLYTRIEKLKALAGTWNVAQGRASSDSLVSWLGSSASEASIVVVGLQEVEMGAGFLAMSAAKETVGLEGSSAGQWWLDIIGKTLDEGSTFERVGSRQLAGLLIGVWARSNIKAYVGDVDAGAVACGFGRAIGNKGAVGLRIRLYDRILCFVNCHFAAHLEAVNRRNADFDHVYRTMTFGRSSNLFNSATVASSSAVQVTRNTNAMDAQNAEALPELAEADMVMFLGDFNYRLDGISYDEARDFISQRCFDWLKEKDQLRAEMEAGNVFQGMREPLIKFPPTYKFEKHLPGLAGYGSGEKRRIPAWCDRILFRDSRSTLASECSLECPVVASVSQYDACMDVTDSDHKPVRSLFSIDIARVDEAVRREEFGDIMKTNEDIKCILEQVCEIPETIISTNNILLQDQDTSILRITNKSGRNVALFDIVCEGQSTITKDGQTSDHSPTTSFGFPSWLKVSPCTGIIKPDGIAEMSVYLEDHDVLEEFVDGVLQNSWCEDKSDKEVILRVKVRGTFTTETRDHKVHVRRCIPVKTRQVDSRQKQVNVLYRSDNQLLSTSHDVVDHLYNLHSSS